MIAVTITTKTSTSFQEKFFNDLIPYLQWLVDPPGRRRLPSASGVYYYTKAPQNRLNGATVICRGGYAPVAYESANRPFSQITGGQGVRSIDIEVVSKPPLRFTRLWRADKPQIPSKDPPQAD